MKELITKYKAAVIFLVVTLVQILSWYFASPKFYFENFVPSESTGSTQSFAYLYWFLADIVLLLIIPAVLIKFLFAGRLGAYGINFNHFKTGIKIIVGSAAMMFILIWLASSFTNLSQLHSNLELSKNSFWFIILFEVSLFAYVFAWEFIWRGFMIFGLEEKFGMHVIWMQMIPFVLLHYNKNIFEIVGAVFGGLFLGMLAYRTRSIIYGVVIHYFVLIFADLVSIARMKSGVKGIGLNAIMDLFRYYF